MVTYDAQDKVGEEFDQEVGQFGHGPDGEEEEDEELSGDQRQERGQESQHGGGGEGGERLVIRRERKEGRLGGEVVVSYTVE